jgi:hypothetical protein
MYGYQYNGKGRGQIYSLFKISDNLKEALQERMRLYEEEHHRQEEFSAMR